MHCKPREKGWHSCCCIVTLVHSLIDEIVEASNASNVVVAQAMSTEVAMSSQF
jgi:hypothetical protein